MNVSFLLPLRMPAGTWTITVQELLTGLTQVQEIAVAAAPAVAAVSAVPDVQLVNAPQIQAFVGRPGEKCVIVEAGQENLLPQAKKLAEVLTAAGAKARVWQITPEDFDGIPVRWYPRPEDTNRLKEVDAGRLIGWRQNLKPFIDTKKRAHVPAKGGYAEIAPPFMVGQDCILFSGGRLAESLRSVTPWMATPNVPGSGQGRLLACFSPFVAGKVALVVIANDVAGMTKTADQLAAEFAARPAPAIVAAVPAAWKIWPAAPSTARPVPQPYLVYTPIRRSQRLLATSDGKAVVLLNGQKDTLAFVEREGRDHRYGSSGAEHRGPRPDRRPGPLLGHRRHPVGRRVVQPGHHTAVHRAGRQTRE